MSAPQVENPRQRRRRQPAPPAPDPYMCRVGGGAFALPVLRDLGMDPEQVLLLVGLDPGIFGNPDSIVPLADFYRMIEACHKTSGRPDFGLLIAARAGTSAGGLLLQLAKTAPDVRAAVEAVSGFIHLNLRWGHLKLSVERNVVSLSFSLVLPGTHSATLFEDAAIGILFAVMRELCGPAWRPTEVLLSHSQGPDPTAYTAYFGAPIRYDSVSSGLIFPASVLNRPVPKAENLLHANLTATIKAVAQARPITFAEEIRRTIRGNFEDPGLSADWVAKLHGIDRRALSRRLAAEGTSFSELHSSLRFESAGALLRDSTAPLSAIASALGYSEQSAFSRAFHVWSGTSPKRFRSLESNKQR